MDALLAAYVEAIGQIHGQMKSIVRGSSPEALDWKPEAEANSITVLATHVAGSETFWMGEVILGGPAKRVRAEEFAVAAVDPSLLVDRLDASQEVLRVGLASMNSESLSRQVKSPRDGQSVSVAWALTHILQHSALHLGHMELTRQLWEARAG